MKASDLWPDTPKEWAAIGSAIGRLGTMASTVTLYTADNHLWTLGTLFLTWIGFEVQNYMKIHDSSINGDKPDDPT